MTSHRYHHAILQMRIPVRTRSIMSSPMNAFEQSLRSSIGWTGSSRKSLQMLIRQQRPYVAQSKKAARSVHRLYSVSCSLDSRTPITLNGCRHRFTEPRIFKTCSSSNSRMFRSKLTSFTRYVFTSSCHSSCHSFGSGVQHRA